MVCAACGGGATATTAASAATTAPVATAAPAASAASTPAPTVAPLATAAAWRTAVASQACGLITTKDLVTFTGAVRALPNVGNQGQCSWSLQTMAGTFSSLSLTTYSPDRIAELRTRIASKTGKPIDQLVDGTYTVAGESDTLIHGGGFSLILSGAIDRPADHALKDIAGAISALL